MKVKVFSVVLVGMFFVSSQAFAADCFEATGQSLEDGQSIRKVASSMGWKINKIASVAAGTFIKTKVALYPQDPLMVCVQETSNNSIEFRAQSESSDAGVAKWRSLKAKRK